MTITPWGPVGYITYKRTYARPLGDRTEEFPETIERVLEACNTQLKCEFTDKEINELRDIMLSLKGIVAGRFLWQLGTSTVKKLGLLSLQNCAFTLVNEPIRPFTWAMDALMLGSGVGYNIQKEHVYELPKVRRARIIRRDTKDADFIVPDSREGWVRLLKYVLMAHFGMGESTLSYSTICIRSKGALISGFGGVASGPEELCWGIEKISEVLNNRAGKKLRPVDALDIMNIIGFIVVAGNVRRSAQIAIGDMDDLQFLNAKRWDLGNIPNWRAMSNNSVVCNDFNLLPVDFWEGYKGNGEPYGLINLGLSKSVGRLGETEYSDPLVQGFNPCVEQGLANKETCCLSEIYLPNIKSSSELIKVAKYLYRINKHSLRLKCHLPETQDIVHKQMRMGIGITGIMEAGEKMGWLNDCYKELRKYDKLYSEKMGWPESVKLTTVKPSGTLSLLAGVTSGIHPGYSKYYLRRIRMAANSVLVDKCREAGYKIEPQRNLDGTIDHNTMVVEFPCKHEDGTVLAKDLTAIDQLEKVKELQSIWSDNGVSCTVYYKKNELSAIKKWLKENYNEGVKSCSFLLHNEHGFDQAPLEEISAQQYNALIKKITPITELTINDKDVISGIEECEGGTCPIK